MKRISLCLLALALLAGFATTAKSAEAKAAPKPTTTCKCTTTTTKIPAANQSSETAQRAPSLAQACYQSFLALQKKHALFKLLFRNYIALDLRGVPADLREEFTSLVREYCEKRRLKLLPFGSMEELDRNGYLMRLGKKKFFLRWNGYGQLYEFHVQGVYGDARKITCVVQHGEPELGTAWRCYLQANQAGEWKPEPLERISFADARYVEPPVTGKPVIYLYPPKPMTVDVRVGFGQVDDLVTKPDYGSGWRVLARPDGTLTNLADGKPYPYLFWEAFGPIYPQAKEGFLVPRAGTEQFLREKLRLLGLLPHEYEEFIEFWLPILQRNEWNLIYFAGEEYTNRFPLRITPEPDSLLRVFMVARPAEGNETLPVQELKPFRRSGFTVVEWGGAAG
ncbi:MAG: hypothetical protein LBG83_05830 [Oscillospiraceae bacterium]|jgi:hypothetical protein|nr:hypothetical protein [Oscillospiraceae bacterium]